MPWHYSMCSKSATSSNPLQTAPARQTFAYSPQDDERGRRRKRKRIMIQRGGGISHSITQQFFHFLPSPKSRSCYFPPRSQQCAKHSKPRFKHPLLSLPDRSLKGGRHSGKRYRRCRMSRFLQRVCGRYFRESPSSKTRNRRRPGEGRRMPAGRIHRSRSGEKRAS